MSVRWGSCILVTAAIAIGLSGCGRAAPTPAAAPPSTIAPRDPEVGASIIPMPLMPSDSAYTRAICSVTTDIDAEGDDPLGQLVNQLRRLPAETDDEINEIERLVRLIGAADADDDTDALLEAGAILRARCG